MSRRRENQGIADLPAAFEEMRVDYTAGKRSKFSRNRQGLPPMGSSADWHSRNEGEWLRRLEYARDMVRNDAVPGVLVDRAVTNIMQTGFVLDPQTGDDGANKELFDRWMDWSEDPDQCDLEGEETFSDIEAGVLYQTYVDGDICVLPTIDGSLQRIEAHRLRTPKNTKKNVVNGVLLDDNRKRLQYWFTKDDIDPLSSLTKVGDTYPYDARDANGFRQVFHIYRPTRATQTRGVTAFAPVFDKLGMYEDVDFAQLVKAQIASAITSFIERDKDFKSPNRTAKIGAQSQEQLTDGSSRIVENIGAATQITGLPGEKYQMNSPNVPNAEYFPHVKHILTMIGINLGLPLFLVIMDPSEGSFSSWRGAFDQAKMGFRRTQKWMRGKFHRQVYQWKVRQWLAEDRVLRSLQEKLGAKKIFAHRWNAPSWPYINPFEDAQSDLLRVRSLQTSPRRMHAEHGQDSDEIVRESVADNGFAIIEAKKMAAAINEKFKDDQPVTWLQVLSLPTPDRVSGAAAAMTPSAGSDSQKQKKPGAANG